MKIKMKSIKKLEI